MTDKKNETAKVLNFDPATWGKTKPEKQLNARSSTINELLEMYGGEYEYLWRGLIPKYNPSMFAGSPEAGKTTICLQAIKEMFETYKTGSIAWVASEGTVDDTIKKMYQLGLPRNDRIHILHSSNNKGNCDFELDTEKGREKLDLAIKSLPEKPFAIFIDSLRGVMSKSTNDEFVGKAMKKVNAIVCGIHRASLIYIHHHTKGPATNKQNKIAGSVDIVASVRLAMNIIPHSETVRHIIKAKSNILFYEIPEVQAVLLPENKKIIISTLMEQKPINQTDECEKWLADFMETNREILSKDLTKMAKDAGYSYRILELARKKLSMVYKRNGKNFIWVWNK